MEYIDFSNLPICDQDWAAMPKVEGGRLCTQCDMTMIDFSGMTNLEIIKKHAETKGRVCGHYAPSQLVSPFQEKGELDAPSFLAKAIIGLSTMTSTLFINPTSPMAQVPVETVVQDENRRVVKRISEKKGQLQDSIVLKGQVVDDKASPLPFASIYVKETEWGVSADESGFFTLILKKEDVSEKDTITLVYFFLGFEPVERELAVATLGKEDVWLGQQMLEVEIEIVVSRTKYEAPMMADVSSFGFVTQPAVKKKWWQKGFLGRIFRKKK